jgi:ribosomal protein L11 methyltransferase
MKESYVSIRCVIPSELEEELPELLSPWPVLGSEIENDLDGRLQVTVYLSAADVHSLRAVRKSLEGSGGRIVEERPFPEDDWLANYRERVRPFPIGELWWIDPQPDRPTEAPVGRRRLVVEPRMAFGTGTHESTQAILVELENLGVKGRKVLDVGTGSGILAFAAECLEAAWVVALDTDPAAVWVAIENAREQEWQSRADLVLGPVGCLEGAEFDIVLCNMIASNFLPLARDLRRLLTPQGVAVFAGLLESEAERVSESLRHAGFGITSQRGLGDWASLTATTVPRP